MSRRSSTSAAAGGLVLAIMVGAVAVSSAQAANDPQAAGRVVVNGTVAYTADAIQADWADLVSSFPGKLPANESFPERPFEFFFPESGPDGDVIGETYFEEGLAESLLARYWRCSWLNANLNAAARGDSKAAGAATEQLNRFGALPGAEGIDLNAYSKAISREAEQVGQSPSQYEYDLECGFYESEGANR